MIHKCYPFDIVHCRGWQCGAVLAELSLNIPVVVTLGECLLDSKGDGKQLRLKEIVDRMESAAVRRADLLVVSSNAIQNALVTRYSLDPSRVWIIPFEEEVRRGEGPPEKGNFRKSIGLNPRMPMALFAGEISHAAGADLLGDALGAICREFGDIQFVFAGDGPLRSELEGRIFHNGLAHRCKFVGHLAHDTFESALKESEFLVIPARTWQGQHVVQQALDHGIPVLATHQAHLDCIRHGENGLLTYDNPGSIEWGVKEMLSNPPGRKMGIISRQIAGGNRSVESIALLYYAAFGTAVRMREGNGHA